MNKRIKILIVVVIVVLVGSIIFWHFDLGFPWGVTNEDISKLNQRWWVIYYKIIEDELPGTVERLMEIEEKLKDEFYPDVKAYDYDFYSNASLKNKYRFAKRWNELMELTLVELEGQEALQEIEGIWSLDEIPELWKR
jgi:hypothetical protein